MVWFEIACHITNTGYGTPKALWNVFMAEEDVFVEEERSQSVLDNSYVDTVW
jgi:hypothetical protein